MPLVEFDREASVEVEVDANDAEHGQTLLEIARSAGIPHAAACGGNARCSTCRVMVLENLENLTPRNKAEKRLAERKGFDDMIRLACQARVTGPVKLRRLVIDEEDIKIAKSSGKKATGKDRKLAILFSDIRNFTAFAENNLAYDVIHILGRYFRKIGGPVLANDGYIDKYMGDGIMAIFGLDQLDPAVACRNAVTAGLGMLDSLQELNVYLREQFHTTFRIGIGIHVGPVIIGEMGHPKKMQFTAIGDTVNIASRIESATKVVGASMLVSSDVRDLLGDFAVYGRSQSVNLKGKTGEHVVTEILKLSAPAAAGDTNAKS